MSGIVAVSELHSRLDYLVSYSSHLIFVACDDMQMQQSTLQSFVAQQQDNIEVAFLKGEETRPDADYRKEIYRQILHKSKGNFDDSLLTMLQDFGGSENQILICLSAAQCISYSLLEEMWELVLLARTLNQSLHVNVILFGEYEWATESKRNLPKNKGNKPVILNLDANGEEGVSSTIEKATNLDAMIAKKRAAFAQRVSDREAQEHAPQKQSVIRTKTFQLAMGLMLLAILVVLVYLFYPKTNESSDTIKDDLPLSAETSEVLTEDTEQPILNEIVKPIESESIENEQQFVTNWQENVEQSTSGKNNKSNIDVNTDESTDSEQQSLQQAPLNKLIGEEKYSESATTPQESTLVDGEEELVVESPAAEPIATAALVSEPIESAPQNNAISESEEKPVAAPPVTETSRLPHPLMEVAAKQFLVQISSTGNLQAAERFISDNKLNDNTWIYTTKRFGGDWHVIVDKKAFQSSNQAKAYIGELKTRLPKISPFVKSIEKIQEEITLAN